ncbi:MAG: ABC transporter ATP-binding protein [Dehalococcoidia bacterium]|nr:ABC transporter ATP-binding protein [Dehalococcoidia bacterium]
MTAKPLLDVRNLSVVYPSSRGLVRAVNDVSFQIQPGEAVGLVGESGSGKSTVLRALLGLIKEPGRIAAGEVVFKGRDLRALDPEEMRAIRGGQISMIFQDPVNAFNPAFTIRSQLTRALKLHRATPPPDGYDAEILRMLRRVGIDARGKLDSYPFNFSQGQLQRIMIAAATMAGQPALLLADEPTTSLDVTIEAQVLQLLRDLRRELGLALILVTHNLALVAELCDRVLVMYAGRIVEESDVFRMFEEPSHPYTAQLLRAIPSFPHRGDRLYAMRGSVPDLARPPKGCAFAPRCEQYLGARCDETRPELLPAGPDQRAACHLYADGPAPHKHLATAMAEREAPA